MSISDADKRAIDEAVAREHWVSTDDNGNRFIEMFADYNDTNEFLLKTAYEKRNAAFSPPSGDYEPENDLLYSLQDQISESYEVARFDYEDQLIRIAGFDPSDDMAQEQLEYLRENYPFEPPYEHFLSQTMKVNIMLTTPEEKNADHGLTKRIYLALACPEELTDGSPEGISEILESDSMLKRLVEQQGYSMTDLCVTMQDYEKAFYDEEGWPSKEFDAVGNELPLGKRIDAFNKSHSAFLTSICSELENQTYSMGTMTVLAQVSMKDFISMMRPGKEITMPKDSMLGIFNPWNGAGSSLEIELAKEFCFKSEDIYDIQIEGAEPDFGYTVDSSYGLIGSCWKEPVSIQDAVPERKPSLDAIIQNAAGRSNHDIRETAPARDIQL